MGMGKKVLKTLGRPFWKPVRKVFYTRIDWRIAEFLEHENVGVVKQLPDNASWNQLVPAFLNSVSTVQTYGRELALLKKQHHDEISELRSEIAVLRAQLAERERATAETFTAVPEN